MVPDLTSHLVCTPHNISMPGYPLPNHEKCRYTIVLPQYVKDSYRRFLENRIRGEWDFTGVPMQIYFRQK